MLKKPIPHNNVERLRQTRGWSMQELADKIGTDASTINKIEKHKNNITSANLIKLSQAFGVPTTEIFGMSMNTDVHHADLRDPAFAEYLKAKKSAENHTQSEPEVQIPVLGTAAGSFERGSFQLSAGVIDWIDRPPALRNARGLYALYVDGSSMEPMFRHGSICVASAHRPPRIGDAVVVEVKTGEHEQQEAYLGILAARNATLTRLRKLNPDLTLEFPQNSIVRMDKILDHAEILGIAT